MPGFRRGRADSLATLAHHRRILAGIILIGLALLGFAGWSIWRSYNHALGQAYLRAESLTRALDHHASRAIEAVGFILNAVAEQIEGDRAARLSPAEIHDLLRQRAAEAPQVDGLIVIDRQGILRHDSEELRPAGLDFSDRLCFAVHRDDAGRGVFISPPAPRGPADRWAVVLSRRLNDPDGSFAGIVAASVDLRYFQDFYRSVRPGPNAALGIVTTGARLFVREPPAPPGQDLSENAFFREHLGTAYGTYEGRSLIDGRMRLLSYRRLSELPLIVYTAIAKEEALVEWRRAALQTGGFAALLLVAIGVAATFGLRELRRREAAEHVTHSTLRQLARQHTVMDTILTTLPDGVCLLDADLKLAGWNDRIFEVLQVDRDAILRAPDPGRALRRALAVRGEFGRGDPDALVVEREAFLRSGRRLYQRQQYRTGRWIEVRGVPVPGQGYLFVSRDVTEEVVREAELRDANARLEAQAVELDAMRRRAEEARFAAEQANRAKSSFLANMSHELRTPLNAINGFSEIIADLRFGPQAIAQYQDYARDIQKSGEHLLDLINSILDLAKIEAGRMDLHEEPVDLAACVHALLRMVEPAAAAKPVSLTFDAPHEPLVLMADEQKLRQSLLNVLSNAIKFTPAGGAVRLWIERHPQEVALVVRDTGIGIRPEDQWRVFSPFVQVDSVLTRRAAGTGLGMPLTKSLIELHGGRVTLESAEGCGTTVAIRLPIGRFEAQQPRRAMG